MNPFEEIRNVIELINQTKINIETTDLEYFEADKMLELARACKDLSEIAYKTASDMNDDKIL